LFVAEVMHKARNATLFPFAIDIPCQWPSSLCDKIDSLQLTIRDVQIVVLLIKIRVALRSTEAFPFVLGDTPPRAKEEVWRGERDIYDKYY
jgi:hypothetical protein